MLLNRAFHQMSFSSFKIPTIDLTKYINRSAGWESDCKQTARLFKQYGLVYAFDPRVDQTKNQRFLDQMEQYFSLRSQQFDQGIRNLDNNDDPLPLGLKFGNHQKMAPYVEEKSKLKDPHKSLSPQTTALDPTWRYHHVLNSKNNFTPKQFPKFQQTMQNWGHCLYGAGNTIAEMTAIGLGLPANALSKTIQSGLLYLSPPACDLSKSKPSDVITGFHRDFTLFTVHGRARYSGLYAWLLTGEKFLVQMPENHILIQSGTQLQWLTGGYLKAGFHEVIHNERLQEQKKASLREGRSLWRVASTMFCHVEGDLSIEPYDKFRSQEVDEKYPAMTSSEYLLREVNSLYPQ